MDNMFGEEKETTADIVAQYLTTISIDEDFLSEVTNALQSEEEIEEMKCYLDVNPYLVPSEVFDILERITNGRFKKESVPSRLNKIKFLQEPKEENMKALVDSLKGTKVITLAALNMEDPMAMMDSPDPIQPIMLSTPDGKVIIPIFTSQFELPRERIQNFMMNEMEFEIVLKYMEAVEKVSGQDCILALDMESAACVELTKSDVL